jgi:hypothetical protein
MIFYASIYSIGENVIDDFIGYMSIFIHKPLLESFVNATTGDFNRFLDVTHWLVYVLHAIVRLVFLADLEALFNGQMLIHAKRFSQMLGLQLAHKRHVKKRSFLR